ncbi:MAG: serine/threonine-protein kinase [Acidobacteria bacterium]|nr:serine/threonine-protein kinase [Acidobacteriota bacterium]
MDERQRDLASEETVAMPAEEMAAAATPIASTSRPATSLSRLSKVSAVDEGRFIPGTLLGGRYRIIGLLGKGGMGEVYRATDLTLGQAVALKFLPEALAANERFIERFQSEVRVARQVSHPNVCRVYDIGEVEGLPFISMEYVDGEDLSGLLQRIGRLPADIHRDLKPQNIMLNKRGEPVIMDFGLAAIADTMSGPEARNGTPAYMSPEQLRGVEVTAKSDIYALGLVLYELFTGKKPYDAQTIPQLLDLQDAIQLTSMSSVAADIDPAVEKVIRRCLDPQPAKRPTTPLAIAAALPGGDPLAAALAAGETPSPEMVAAAGSNEGLSRKWALVCLGIVVVCLLAQPLLKQRDGALYHAPIEYPPAVLQQKAREMAEKFGYGQKPKDQKLWLVNRQRLLQYMQSLKVPKNWDAWLAGESPLAARYRESLQDLIAYPTGNVSGDNPAPIAPGMVEIELDGQARLRSFHAVPYGAGQELPQPIAVEDVFRAAQLDMSKFSEIAPRTTPRSATDQLQAWHGPHPVLPQTQITFEVGTWKGRLTHARLVWPWMKEDGTVAQQESIADQLRLGLGVLAALTGLTFAALLARRNWKAGRADRRGALRLGVAMTIFLLLARAGQVHAVVSVEMLTLAFASFGISLSAGVIVWMLYLALEPALRARWPHSIVTWNRLIAGRWKDPQVCAHVLIGAALALVVLVVPSAVDLNAVERSGLGTAGNVTVLEGVRAWMATYADNLANCIQTGLVLFFVIFGLRQVLRRDWLAALAGTLLFAFLQGFSPSEPNWVFTFAMYLAIYAVLMFALVRLGLVTAMTVVFFVNLPGNAIIGMDWRTWYAPTGLATLAVLLGLTVTAFKYSLGSRELLGGDESTRAW